LSGGIDSSTTLAHAIQEGYETYALSFDYAQRHARELESARLIASFLGAKRHLIIRCSMRDIGGSALTSRMAVPKAPVTPSSSSPIPPTYVPARNTIFLSFALGWAEVLEAADIFIGANAVDYSGYPDCRPEYLRAFEAMANLATKASVDGNVRFKIHSPIISMTKSDIIRHGQRLGLDFSLTWSCYDPQPRKRQRAKDNGRLYKAKVAHVIPCGMCESCLFRAKGFREAGIIDPLYGQS
jgi:7-cyano-7-deazaguanine synthase